MFSATGGEVINVRRPLIADTLVFFGISGESGYLNVRSNLIPVTLWFFSERDKDGKN